MSSKKVSRFRGSTSGLGRRLVSSHSAPSKRPSHAPRMPGRSRARNSEPPGKTRASEARADRPEGRPRPGERLLGTCVSPRKEARGGAAPRALLSRGVRGDGPEREAEDAAAAPAPVTVRNK